MKVRTRFAPSPTGSLHIGGIRTALYAYALARKHGGQFALRIEDTDQDRYKVGSIEEIYAMLSAYGIEPDESPLQSGNFGPYIQSERKEIYRKYARELVETGAAYYCFLSKEEVEKIQKDNRLTGTPLRSPYRNLSLAEAKEKIAAGQSFVVRQKVPQGRTIVFKDGVQGEMKFETNNVEDGVLLKSDGLPTYHLAVVVDDHLMKITHVFRAAEWISSTPKHILLHEAFGWEMPQIFHLTAILDPEGGKLSKRKGSVSARSFLIEGYLPEAVLNFLMLLGWASPEKRTYGETEREFYTLSEFVDLFDLNQFNKSNPVFNREKLLWFNQKYIAGQLEDNLAKRLVDWMETYAEDKTLLDFLKRDLELEELDDKVILVRERAKTLVEVAEGLKFFYIAPSDIDWNIKQLASVRNLIEDIRCDIADFLATLAPDTQNWSQDEWEMGLRAIGDKHEVKHADVFMILRVAVVGSPFSPSLLESLQLLGKEEVLKRVRG